MNYFVEIQFPSVSLNNGFYQNETKRLFLEKLMNSKLASCDLLQHFAYLENEIAKEIDEILKRVDIANNHFQFDFQDELRISYVSYQNSLLELIKFKKEIIEYHSSIIEKFIEENNLVTNKVSSGTIINNIDFYCLLPSSYISYLCPTSNEIESEIKKLIERKEKERNSYETLFQTVYGYDVEIELKSLLKEIKIIDKESYFEVINDNQIQERFNKIIFNLNFSIGMELFKYIESIKNFKDDRIQLLREIKPLQTKTIKSLIKDYNIDQTSSDVLLILLQRALFYKIKSIILSTPIQIIDLTDEQFIKKQEELKTESFSNFDKLSSNIELNEFIKSIDFTQTYVPYDFILDLNVLFGELTSLCDIDVSGDTIIPIIIYVLLHCQILNINLLMCFIDLFTPSYLIKGKLSYTTTTFRAAVHLITQPLPPQN